MPCGFRRPYHRNTSRFHPGSASSTLDWRSGIMTLPSSPAMNEGEYQRSSDQRITQHAALGDGRSNDGTKDAYTVPHDAISLSITCLLSISRASIRSYLMQATSRSVYVHGCCRGIFVVEAVKQDEKVVLANIRGDYSNVTWWCSWRLRLNRPVLFRFFACVCTCLEQRTLQVSEHRLARYRCS